MSFSLDISRFVEKAKGNLILVIQKVELDLLVRVVRMTPVDSGRARGNWMVEHGSPPKGEHYPETGDEKKSQAERKSQRFAIDAGTAKIEETEPGGYLYIVNNVPYIIELEDGRSTQAPAGMLRVTLRNYPGIVEQAASELDR